MKITIWAKLLIAGASTFLAVSATQVQASDTDIFASCDGMGKPGKSPNGLSSPANESRFSQYSAGWKAIITACDAALAHPKLLPSQGLRRATLLRGRARAFARGGKFEEALADIDAAGAAAKSNTAEPLYTRSFAVSLDLLRALFYDQTGKNDEALRLARQSAAARPFAFEVQRVAAHLLLMHRQKDDGAKAIILSARRLDPDFVLYQTGFLALLGDFDAVAELEIPAPPPAEIEDNKKNVNSAAFADFNAFSEQLRSRLILAYARAATGDGVGAKRDLAETRARYDAVILPLDQTVSEEARKLLFKKDTDLFASFETRIDARIALSEGRRQDAEALVNGKSLPLDTVSTDLFAAMRNKPAAGSTAPTFSPPPVSEILAGQTAGVRKQLLDQMLSLAMVEPETVKTNSVYKRSRPNILGALVGAAVTMGVSLLQGVDNTDGFSAKQGTDGTVRVSLTGATPAPAVVREMVLLRAAELSLENNKPAFVIAARNDYARYQTTSQRGYEISRIPTGYKSDLVIRFDEVDAKSTRAFDAKTIVDTLGPFYYKDDKK